MSIAIVLFLLTTCFAQPTPSPTTQAAWQITITAVEGINQGRSSPDQPWRRLEVGMRLSQGAEVRNGTRSAVRFTVPSGREITLDRLGTLKIDPETLEMNQANRWTRIAPTSTLRTYSGPPRYDRRN